MSAVVRKVLNRTQQSVFLEALDAEIDACRSRRGGFGLLLLQLKNFDELNLSLGYAAVDALLAEIASRLEAAFRGQGQCLRVGTKKFALVLEEIPAAAYALLAASKAERLVHEPLSSQAGRRIKIDPAVGVALYPEHADSAQSLLQSAESALKRARDTDRVTVYDSHTTGQVRALHEAEVALMVALEHGGIEVYFQPQVDVASGAPVGAEALLRCRDGDGTFLPPERVVQAATRARLLPDMSRAVLNTALRYASEWPDERLCVSFNVSPQSLKDTEFIDSIESTLGIWSWETSRLSIEITESAFMDDPETSLPIMRRLRDQGTRVSIDDFGTGYSSFSYFKDIPANELKVDKSFVQNMHENEADRRIVQAVIALAHQFELEVVAEGVENPAGFAILRELGCDVAQGFWVGKPMPPPAFVEWLARRS